MATESTAREIPYVRKDDTFKTWREGIKEMIHQQNNIVRLYEFEMLGVSDPYVIASLQMAFFEEE